MKTATTCEAGCEQEATKTMINLRQGTLLRAKMNFEFVSPTTGRKRRVKEGDIFWIASPIQNNAAGAALARKNENMRAGVMFDHSVIALAFELLDE